MSNDQSQADWEETVFTVALLLTCVVFLVAAMTVTTHEESGLTAKSLPIILSVAISIFSAVKAISMLRSAHRHQVYLLRTDGITAKIILPLSMTMVLYVPMVMLFGYVLASVMVLMIVLRVFGVRDRVFIFAISVVVGIVADYVFVDTLGMFMPTGWLIETVHELL